MKKMNKGVIILIVATILEACAFFLSPLVNHLKGYDLGLAVLLPVLVVPVVSLVHGLLYYKKIQLLFPIVTVLMTLIHLLVIYKCANIVYIVLFAVLSIVFMGLGMGIKFLVSKLISLIRKKKPAKN